VARIGTTPDAGHAPRALLSTTMRATRTLFALLPLLIGGAVAALGVRSVIERGAYAPADEGPLALRANLARVGVLECLNLGEQGERAFSVEPLAGLGERWRAALPGLTVDVGWDLGRQERGPRTPRGAARVVVGPVDSAALGALFARAGLDARIVAGAPGGAEAQDVELFGRRYPAATFAMACTFADPEREGLPLTLVAGSARSRARALEVWAPDVRPRWAAWSDGVRVMEGRLDPRGGLRTNALLDVAAPEAETFEAPVDVETAARWSRDFEARARAALERAETLFDGRGPAFQLPELRLAHDADRLQRDGALERGASYDRWHGAGHGRLTALVGPTFEADALAVLLEARLAEVYGRPRDAWMLESLARELVDFAGTATVDGPNLLPGLDTWVGDGAATDGASIPDGTAAADGLDLIESLARRGHLDRRVTAAWLFWVLREELGDDAVARVWRLGLERKERARIVAAAEAHIAARRRSVDATSPRADITPRTPSGPGVVVHAPLSPTPYGHGTAAARRSFERLAAASAGAAFVTVHVVVPRVGQGFGAPYSLEGDAAVARSVEVLRAQGLAVVLAVQPLTQESGPGPCDSTQLGSAELWRDAVERHALGVSHGAFVARYAGADAFCVARGARDLFLLGYLGPGEEPAWHAAVRLAKERGWSRIVAAAEASGVPLFAIAPNAPLAEQLLGFLGAAERTNSRPLAIGVELADGVAPPPVGSFDIVLAPAPFDTGAHAGNPQGATRGALGAPWSLYGLWRTDSVTRRGDPDDLARRTPSELTRVFAR